MVSNRLPITQQSGKAGALRPSSGGLVTALDPVLRARGGTWVGWLGDGATLTTESLEGLLPYRLRAVPIQREEVEQYYSGFSNRCLWPLFHSLVDRTHFDVRAWDAYERVNARFAEHTAEVARAGDVVWIHDYQLMRTPDHVQRLVPGAQLAFFLHIPFPPFDIYRLLPCGRSLLHGLLACRLVGFHTASYVRNFLDCVEEMLGERVDRARGLVEHGDRIVHVGAFPIGIDFGLFERRAHGATAGPQGMPPRYVLGVDRLDYTKGLPERLRAFERLLELHPEHREKVALVQVVVPSRSKVVEYRQLKRTVDEEVGRINGRFATAAWVPIRHLHRSVDPDQLAALYRHADVALVTPLRDGMNLVAKEFVASQVDRPGVLVLSRLAGTAETMSEALLVNPYDVERTAAAIHRALTMDESERRSRMVALRERERKMDVHAWTAGLLEAVRMPPSSQLPLAPSDLEAYLAPVLARRRIVLFLAYDGTLARLRSHPDEVVLEERTRRALRSCVAHPEIDVVVISGRSLEDVRRRVGEEGIIYAGNHGLEVEGRGIASFRHDDLEHYCAEVPGIAVALRQIARQGAWVEEKGATLAFHHAQVAPEYREDLAVRAREVIVRLGFVARDARGAVEARPPVAWDKGTAALHILRVLHGPDWPRTARVLYAGDDETDEDAFRTLGGLGLTIRIGSAEQHTAADRRLRDPEAMGVVLEWLGCRPSRKDARHAPTHEPPAVACVSDRRDGFEATGGSRGASGEG